MVGTHLEPVGLDRQLGAAGTIVLAPVSHVSVTVPTTAQGDVMSDLSARRGHINATTSLDDGLVLIEASVPEAELARYVLDLRSLTGGRAELSIEADRFEVCPDHLVPA